MAENHLGSYSRLWVDLMSDGLFPGGEQVRAPVLLCGHPPSGAAGFCSRGGADWLKAILVHPSLDLGPSHFWSQGSEAPAVCSGFHFQEDEDILFTRTWKA